MLFFIIEAEELDVQQARWSIEAFFKPTDESAQRAELVKTLGEVLVKKMMPFSLLYSGELETKHRVQLRMIEKSEHKNILHMPQYTCVNLKRYCNLHQVSMTEPLHASQKVVKRDEEMARVHLDVLLNEELYLKLMGYGPFVRVVKPLALKRTLSEWFELGWRNQGGRV
jgi:hypothetical protein